MTRLDVFNYNWSCVRLEVRNAWICWNPTERKHLYDNKYKIAVYDSKLSYGYYLSTRMGELLYLRLWARYLNDDALRIIPCNYINCGFDYIPFDTLDALQQYINKEAMVEKL